jgi:hypothetical protein
MKDDSGSNGFVNRSGTINNSPAIIIFSWNYDNLTLMNEKQNNHEKFRFIYHR